MPEVCRFFGIVIRMFYNDHEPPHFHAFYGGKLVRINIETLTLLEGKLPPRALGLIVEWAALHQKELLRNGNRARKRREIRKIAPLG